MAHPNLVELPGGDWALPYTGFNVPHKYPRVKAKRNSGYALWPKGRLMSLDADEQGFFQTLAIVPPRSHLHINAITPRAGSIRVEVCDTNGQVLPGRAFADSVPLMGDLHWAPVVWTEHDDMGVDPGAPVILRFGLDKVQLFGLEFR